MFWDDSRSNTPTRRRVAFIPAKSSENSRSRKKSVSKAKDPRILIDKIPGITYNVGR